MIHRIKKWFLNWRWFWRTVYEVRQWRFCRCRNCQTLGFRRYVLSMTMYPDDGIRWDDPKNPNYVGHLCRACAEEYREYWQERWDDYNAGRL